VTRAKSNIKGLLSSKKAGDILFVSDFSGRGTEAAIRKSLSRLVEKGRLRRLAHGIYYLPMIDPELGELRPSAEQVAQKIAQKEKVHIYPTGVYALNRLGLSTQVPTKLVYLTDGVPRLLTIGKMKVRFKATTPKKLALKGPLSRLIILALDELDTDNMSFEHECRIRGLLLQEDPRMLKHDLALASGRIHDYIVKLLRHPLLDDRMVETDN
jgi:hypothetical protein